MPEAYLADEYLMLFEQAAPFDEFQNFGIDPDEDWDFEDVSHLYLDD